MRARSMVLAALGAAFVLGATAPAFADEDGWRRHEWREHEWRQRQWRENEWREHHPYYYGRPVYAPPPAYGYYGAPPVYYGNPGAGFGFTVR